MKKMWERQPVRDSSRDHVRALEGECERVATLKFSFIKAIVFDPVQPIGFVAVKHEIKIVQVKHFHHELFDFRIAKLELGHVEGPLASANIALPWQIFFQKREWL
jgi:hypothetical protein